MRNQTAFAGCLIAAVMVSACGGSDPAVEHGGGGPTAAGFQGAFQGTWVSICVAATGAGVSSKTKMVVAGLSTVSSGYSFTGTTCGGSGQLFFTKPGTYSIGAPVATCLGGSPVTAFQLDSVSGGVASYGIAYIDTSVTPNRLYAGAYSTAFDGSTPAKRQTVLDATFWHARQ